MGHRPILASARVQYLPIHVQSFLITLTYRAYTLPIRVTTRFDSNGCQISRLATELPLCNSGRTHRWSKAFSSRQHCS